MQSSTKCDLHAGMCISNVSPSLSQNVTDPYLNQILFENKCKMSS